MKIYKYKSYLQKKMYLQNNLYIAYKFQYSCLKKNQFFIDFGFSHTESCVSRKRGRRFLRRTTDRVKEFGKGIFYMKLVHQKTV